MNRDHLKWIFGTTAVAFCLSAAPGGQSNDIAMMQCSKTASSSCDLDADVEDFLSNDCMESCEAPSSSDQSDASEELMLQKKSAEVALENE